MIKSCPFCGKQPDVCGSDDIGTLIYISCCIVDICYQISDYLTMQERETWCNKTYKYAKGLRKKVYDIMINDWNTRKG